MTGAAGRLGLVVLGLLLVLTYLLLRSGAPDAALHERRLRAIDALILNQAALQRDVLRVSHGLLLNYDPLVAAVTRLRETAAELRGAGAAPGPEIEGIAAALDEQEDLVESFKSTHALLRNSLLYFSHASHGFGISDGAADSQAALVVGRLASTMLQFVTGAAGEAERAELAALLDQLALLPVPAALQEEIDTLRAHGGLILGTLPAANAALASLLTTHIAEQARGLQDLFIEQQRQAETKARVFRVLLYLASVLLLIYLSWLYVRLHVNAHTLQARLDFEQLIAGISARLIDRPLEQTAIGVRQGLEQLGRHAGVDRVYLVPYPNGAIAGGSQTWLREGRDAPGGWPDGALAFRSAWPAERFEHDGCIDVPAVAALPPGEQRARLTELGIRSWLCVPVWNAGRLIGVLGFDAVASEKRWSGEDIALLRTIGDVFASALGRAQAEIDKRSLEASLRHARRIEALGTLSGGIAHDFNNILAAILGYAELALETLAPDSRGWRYLQEVMKAGQRARDVVNRILAFSRHSEQPHAPLWMRPLLEETARLLGAVLPSTIDLRVQLPDEDVVVQGDPGRLQQVVMNLCTNAAQATAEEGVVELVLDTLALDGERALSHGMLVAGRYVRITVRDRGHGMDAATLERIFDPFFTTKAVGMGTGLGLAMVHGIVSDHGGAVDVRSEPGAGTCFEVFLPEGTAPPTADDRGPAPLPLGQGETILIVDDETPLVRLGEEMLARLGYEPVGFDQSAAALAAFRADPERFDLVLTDEIMPGITGTELANAVHALRPDLPIILMTGHYGRTDPPEPGAAGIHEILRKPLSSADLATGLARHLARP